VEELDALSNNAIVMRHFWQPFDVGLDVILTTTDASGTSYFLHDANKNVMQKTAANGTLQETYAYAPFGEINGINGAHIGFSSEISEYMSNLVYFNYRYLQSTIGRWLERDPIGILGGINFYSFINDPIDHHDYLGLHFDKGKQWEKRKKRVITKEELEKLFQKWFEEEYSKIYDEHGNIRSDAWIHKLKPCPNKVKIVTYRLRHMNGDKTPEWRTHKRIIVPPGWNQGSFFFLYAHRYHPGGEYEIREDVQDVDGVKHGNQCIYDKCGNLLGEKNRG
jgi:RHS repeat-associated protein